MPDERPLELPGYPGGADVVGNWVNEQFQLDAFGEALLLFAAAARPTGSTPTAGARPRSRSRRSTTRWHEPDAGIWELDPAEWTHSRLICAAGLRAIAPARPRHAARALGRARRHDRRRHARERLHPTGRWQRRPTTRGVDAALLLPAIRGAIPRRRSRARSRPCARSRDELTEDGYAYRFRPDERPLGEAEGAFLLCGFWCRWRYAQQGDTVAAARWFERNRAACGPPGLLSEEFDVAQRQLRGNLPQAFVHALLLECAVEQQQPAGEE